MKAKTQHTYELELRRMIKSRTGEDCEPWLYPQIRTTASLMVMLDKVQEELLKSNLVNIMEGSMQQQKNEVNPLVPYYDKLQRNLTDQFSVLGLNYKTTPKKITENTKKGGAEHDKMREMLDELNNMRNE